MLSEFRSAAASIGALNKLFVIPEARSLDIYIMHYIPWVVLYVVDFWTKITGGVGDLARAFERKSLRRRAVASRVSNYPFPEGDHDL